MTKPQALSQARAIVEWWSRATDQLPDYVRFAPSFVIDDGFEQAGLEEFRTEVDDTAALRDVGDVLFLFDDSSNAGVISFEGIDTVTSIRHRFIWIIHYSDEAISRITRASSFGRGTF